MKQMKESLALKNGKISIVVRKKNAWFYHKGEKFISLSQKDTMSLATVMLEFIQLISKPNDHR
jgi:hypothetical protein